MNPFAKVLRWLRPAVDPEAETESQRIRSSIETMRTSQLGPAGVSTLPPTPDVTDSKR